MAKQSAGIQRARAQLRVQPPKVTKAFKLGQLKAQLPGQAQLAGLMDTVTLTPRIPFASGVASCEFQLPLVVNAAEDLVEFYDFPPLASWLGASFGPTVFVNLKVIRKTKPHLLTIYIDSSLDETFVLKEGNLTSPTLQQTYAVESGPRIILFAFLPTRTGQHRFSVAPKRLLEKGTSPFIFSRVEIDVVT